MLLLARTGHLNRAYQTFSYLKHHEHLAIGLDPCPPLIDRGSLRTDLKPGFSAIYPDTKLPEPLGKVNMKSLR